MVVTALKGEIVVDYQAEGYDVWKLLDSKRNPDAYKINGIIAGLKNIDGLMNSTLANYTASKLGRATNIRPDMQGGIDIIIDEFLPSQFCTNNVRYLNTDSLKKDDLERMDWISKEATREAIAQIKEESELRKNYLQLTEAGRKNLIEIIFPYGNDRITNEDVYNKYLELANIRDNELDKLYQKLYILLDDGTCMPLTEKWLNKFFNPKNICPGIIVLKPDDIDDLRHKVRTIDILLYNYANNTLNGVKDPSNTDSIKVNKYDLFEIAAQDSLGCSSEEFQAKYAKELDEIKNTQTQANSRGMTKSSGLSESAVAVREKVEAFRTKLVELYGIYSNPNAPMTIYENLINDALYNKAWNDESDIKIINNNYENPAEFRLPKSWIVKEVYKKALQEVFDKEGINGINDIKTENNNAPKTRKYLQNGQIIIEKTNANGSKSQYSTSGEHIK